MTPLSPSTRCRHRHGPSVTIPLVTEFTANSIRVSAVTDGVCLRWRLYPETLDAVAWHLFEHDVLAEARERLAARLASTPTPPGVPTQVRAGRENRNADADSIRSSPSPSTRGGVAAVSTAYRQTRAEQETTIRWDRADDQVHVWSADPVTWRRMAHLGFDPVRETRFPGGATSGRFYRIPVNRFAWGLKRVGTPRVPPQRRLVETPGGAHNAT